ncbi:MAG: Spore protein SP21 [Candidatus Aminicenantes bacterium ADurb.Bin508]|nr:MAG: Spore protein SP21 [Candidatus Aminicenantes bacterium ADurb.Bin508]HNX41742.1 Hsp20/alpha crystallin family protein [Candidatus Aminicenantes bacterium]HPB54497.1 Hsp20/alpha crystallin family protein [Candidatus Aminicenantes bacterium]HPS99883.1 Hsp20/alpha crystallin family protein [Candidatus Aminicenantes bacterium]
MNERTMKLLSTDPMELFFNDFSSRTGEQAAKNWQPATDIWETPENFMLRAELPGFKREEISLEVKENLLTIGGERKEEFDQEQVHCFRRESFRGSFQRAYLLPNNIDTSRIKATMEKGVLEITLPKSERAKAKRIEIGD